MNLGMFPEGIDRTAAVVLMARAAGCTCNVEVDLEGGPKVGRVRQVVARHDDWCPLIVRAERRN
jgi:hypothetical protein